MARPKLNAPLPAPSQAEPWQAMADPPHPMHQELLRRMSAAPAITAGAAGWSGPARFATAFYLGLGSWAVFGLIALLVSRFI